MQEKINLNVNTNSMNNPLTPNFKNKNFESKSLFENKIKEFILNARLD